MFIYFASFPSPHDINVERNIHEFYTPKENLLWGWGAPQSTGRLKCHRYFRRRSKVSTTLFLPAKLIVTSRPTFIIRKSFRKLPVINSETSKDNFSAKTLVHVRREIFRYRNCFGKHVGGNFHYQGNIFFSARELMSEWVVEKVISRHTFSWLLWLFETVF